MTGYVYPFGPKATVGRIDQGQDFGGTGVIRAIGDARIVRTGAPGWPGGNGVLYKLLNGSYAGKYIFVYEGIRPSVRAGQTVRAGQSIGTLIPGSETGIEIGFADSSGTPISHAEYTEGKETKGGKMMAAFLEKLKGGDGGSGGFISGVKGTVDEALELSVGGVADILAGGGGDTGKAARGAIGGVAGEVIEGLVSLLGVKAAPILLNIGLVGGGAFLAYYGVAHAVGVDHPVGTPVRSAATAVKTSAVAA